MKVLRTALLSAFLMVCFAHIGYAQRTTYFTPHVGEMSIRTGNSELDVKYSVVAPANSFTYITIRHNVDGASPELMYSEIFNSSTTAIVNTDVFTTINAIGYAADEVIVECTTCAPNDACSTQRCIVVVDYM